MTRFVSLMYHNLSDTPESPYDVRPAIFERQLDWLIEQRFVVDDFAGCAQRLERLGSDPSAAFPEHYVVLGFDDGHQSNLHAADILQERGLRATFFCCRDVSSRSEFLDPEGIRQLATGMSIGSHGATHRALTRMPFAEAEEELRASRSWLEDLLGQPVPWFSAPFGELDRPLHLAARSAGYELIGDSMEWTNRPQRVAATRRVHRIMVDGRGSERDQHARFQAAATHAGSYLLRRRARYELARAIKSVLSEEQIHRLAKLKRRLLA